MQFINDTIAKGSLLMLQCKNKSCEEYRAVLRPSTNTTVTSSINVPPAEYTAVFFHDLEENGLPNVSPAFKQRRTVVVEEAESKLSHLPHQNVGKTKMSLLLTLASSSLYESTIK